MNLSFILKIRVADIYFHVEVEHNMVIVTKINKTRKHKKFLSSLFINFAQCKHKKQQRVA